MRIVIAGGTGFLGRPLSAAFAADGHDIVLLSRSAQPTSTGPRHVEWAADGTAGPWASTIDGADAVINLAGESIAARRWTTAQKNRILESRVHATRSLVEAIRKAAAPPRVFVSGSAVGYYGPLGDQVTTEDARAGDDFLARVCVAWEGEAQKASGDRTRVVCVRTGVVLEKDGGALPQMLPPFRFGMGGPIGSGRQYLPWIHRDDWVAMMKWTIATTAAAGPINATAPA